MINRSVDQLVVQKPNQVGPELSVPFDSGSSRIGLRLRRNGSRVEVVLNVSVGP